MALDKRRFAGVGEVARPSALHGQLARFHPLPPISVCRLTITNISAGAPGLRPAGRRLLRPAGPQVLVLLLSAVGQFVLALLSVVRPPGVSGHDRRVAGWRGASTV